MTDPGQLSLFGMESEAAAPRQARFWSWNPWHGCTKVSPGCQYCYVYRNDARYGTVAASSVCRKNADFDLPLRRGRNGAYKIPSGATVMTSFTSDFLLADADEWRADCFRMMRSRSDLQFVFFTKRIERLSAFLPDDWEAGYDNVTIGCTCEDQIRAEMRLPLFLALLERLFPGIGSLTDSQELDVLCYILVVSVGLSILFNRNASSGGLDIVAKILNKYLHIELGRAMSLSGICVALSAALVYDKKTVVLSVLGTYFNGLVLDHFIFDHNIKRRVCIITKKEEALRRFILDDLHSGATVYESYGAYNMEKHREIITIVDKAEYQRLMNFMNREDPQAFITVYTVSDIRYQPKV